ncbi:Planctomycete cytochrome C [Symmachiella macrocystis]|uniref:Planctomycete cytochrome C n=1 Tax=Symmachiella macrocystis TaxID=2527985 RepID=A0A5C6BS85_9PLAN|nr:PSD1 and planctomycete cytochrome C domain-containing protein [Symmachiella macrocystis]TWU14815.1 Planctomycete cytochrome C [Symmachiella macrocystis]
MFRTLPWGCLCLVALSGLASADELVQPDAAVSFEKQIRPIFRTYCYDCHGSGEEHAGGLDLRLRRFMITGGESGSVLEPGEPDSSYLMDRLRDGDMPPGEKKLSAEDISTIEKWIAVGAPTIRSEPEKLGRGLGITPEERAYWAFQPIVRPDVPVFAPQDSVRSPIDALLLAKMREKGLSFSNDASRLTLLRRAHLDLIGIPPTMDEIVQFLADDSLDAYERLIDRLLDSPQYGERWGRHWLDVAGYADSEGYTVRDNVRNYAYKYRDYVIRSLNADKPFDEFIVEQLAGDELVPQPHANLSPENLEKLVATGFLRMGADGTDGGADELDLARNQALAETIKIVSTSLLGMSVGCAQCHDHRYDPISHDDYYQLRAIFEPAYDWKNWRTPSQRRLSLYTDEERAAAAAVEAEVAKVAAERKKRQDELMAQALDAEVAKIEDKELGKRLRTIYRTPAAKRTPDDVALFKMHPNFNISPGNLYQYISTSREELKKFDDRIGEIRKKKPVEDFVRILTEVPGRVPETFLFHRGDHQQPKHEVIPAALTVAAPEGKPFEIAKNDESLPTTGRRLAYAHWLTNGRHPLLARVIANRVWLHHFGRGIVPTPADFGTAGQPPTHPKLLDWLADEFMAQGWSLKQLHRTILLSTTYRQSSETDESKHQIDSSNFYYWKKPVVRLDAEVIRDHVLATAGTLSGAMYGPPVPVKEDFVGQIVVGGDDTRRSVYIQQRRSQPMALLTAFDAPVMETNCELRPISTAATQSLMLMNGEFMLAHAKKFAQRLQREAGENVRRQVQIAWQLAYSRPATQAELDDSVQFLDEQIVYLKQNPPPAPPKKKGEADPPSPPTPQFEALTNLCHVLLNSNEFLYME